MRFIESLKRNKKRIIAIICISLGSYLVAFFIDQYYIEGKKWWFILDLFR